MKLSYKFIAFIIVCTLQLTDYKIGSVKFGDIISILIIVYLFINTTSISSTKFYRVLYICFTFFIISSFTVILWVDFYPPSSNLGFLNRVGWISISRYIQLIGCLSFSLYIHNIIISHRSSFNDKFFSYIDQLMFIFFSFFILTYFLSYLGFNTPFIYGEHRLRGGYVEGGPFGLFAVAYFILRGCLFGFWSKKWILLLGCLLIASQSKSAILFLIIILSSYYIFLDKLKLKHIVLIGVFLCILVISINHLFNFSDRLLGYQYDLENIESAIASRKDDPNLVMGRIAGFFIAPEIIRDNAMLGVGLGNYSLVRNNPEYRGVFPAVSEWDLHGLGGIVNLLIETGFIGLFFLAIPFYKFWKRSKSKVVKILIFIFVAAQIFGVQTHFQYIWFIIGVATAISNQSKDQELLTIKLEKHNE